VLETNLRRTPTDDEVAAESGLTMRELRGVYKRSSSTSVLSLDEHIGHTGSTSTLGDMLTQGEAPAPGTGSRTPSSSMSCAKPSGSCPRRTGSSSPCTTSRA